MSFGPLPPISTSVFIACSTVLTGTVCHSVMTPVSLLRLPSQLNFTGSKVGPFLPKKARKGVPRCGMPIVVPSFGAIE
ncbi:hypothetical protein D3C83_75450 [compost metagenome]